nr:histidine kinase [Allomuricauda sp.]
MKRLFVHHPLFRLLTPLFSGSLVYLLILLINNTISDLRENFFGQELYVCIGLAYLIQELARLSLVVFRKLKHPKSFLARLILQVFAMLLVTVVMVSFSMYLYFSKVLLYAPNQTELLIFNSIFCVISMIYVLLYISHQFLYKTNSEKLRKEEWAKLKTEEDFINFKQDINPTLLFESLEGIMVVMKRDPELAEELTDNFASIYRYLLSNKKTEVVPLEKELEVLEEFLRIQHFLAYTKIVLAPTQISNTWIVPGTLLTLSEEIMRTTIPSKKNEITLELIEDKDIFKIKYKHQEKLSKSLQINSLKRLINHYRYYSKVPLKISHEDEFKIVEFPKLQVL